MLRMPSLSWSFLHYGHNPSKIQKSSRVVFFVDFDAPSGLFCRGRPFLFRWQPPSGYDERPDVHLGWGIRLAPDRFLFAAPPLLPGREDLVANRLLWRGLSR